MYRFLISCTMWKWCSKQSLIVHLKTKCAYSFINCHHNIIQNVDLEPWFKFMIIRLHIVNIFDDKFDNPTFHEAYHHYFTFTVSIQFLSIMKFVYTLYLQCVQKLLSWYLAQCLMFWTYVELVILITNWFEIIVSIVDATIQ